MRNFRSLMDLTPWDEKGYSFWGLNRFQAKILGLFFIIIGIAFADPPFSGIPTDFANFWLAGVIYKAIGTSFELALLLTYTVIAWGLLYIGFYIYPYDTERMLSGFINKIKRGISKVFQNPLLLGIGIAMFYFLFHWYKKILETPAGASQPAWESFLTQPTPTTLLVVLGIILLVAILIARRQAK